MKKQASFKYGLAVCLSLATGLAPVAQALARPGGGGGPGGGGFHGGGPGGEDSVAVAAWGPVAVLEAAVWAAVFAPVVPALVVRGVAVAVARALAAQEDFTAAAWAGAAVGAVAPDGAGVAEAGATPIIAGGGVIPVGAGVLVPMAAGAGVGALRLSSAQRSGWR